MAAKKRKGLRSGTVFLITFLAFLLLFGGAMIWGVTEYWGQTHAALPTQPQPTQPVTVRDRTHRVLVVTEEAGEARGFTVLSLDKGVSIRVIPVPRETVVTEGVTQTRLFEYYKTADITRVTAKVGELLGFPLTHYGVITYQNLDRLITHFGEGLIFTLKEQVNYEAAGGGAVNMRAGARTLTPAQAVELLRYTGWHVGRRGMAAAQGEIFAALINQYLVPGRFDDNDSEFAAIIGLCQSDLLASQFAAAREDLLTLAKNNQRGVASVTFPEGEYVGVGEEMRFEMEETPL